MAKKTEKLLVLGIDGLDPRLTKKYLDEGIMPNTKKFLERGAAQFDFEMIGGQPTVTLPCGPHWLPAPAHVYMASQVISNMALTLMKLYITLTPATAAQNRCGTLQQKPA